MQKFPEDLVKLLEEYEGQDDTTQIEIHPKPGDQNTSYVVLTACKRHYNLIHQFYKTINRRHDVEMTKLGEAIQVNNSKPKVAYHQKLLPTSLGLVFFEVEGENKRRGPFRICVKLFSYQTEQISSLKEFTCGSQHDWFRHVYLFEEMETKTIPCDHIDHLLAILNNKFLLLWMYDKSIVVKLEKPDEVLHECNFRSNVEWKPIILDVGLNDSISSKN